MQTRSHLITDSCHSRWIFDPEHRRFRRVLKGLDGGEIAAMTSWRPYQRLDLDEHSNFFVVVLDEGGTRTLRSGRHTAEACPECGDLEPEDLSLVAIALDDELVEQETGSHG